MKKSAVVTLLMLAASGSALATEYGTVLSSTPVTTDVSVPQQQCWDEQQAVQRPNSGVGALVGAVVGGVVGNNVGAGMGRAVATGLGAVAGAAIGDHVESGNNPPVAGTVRRCQSVSRLEPRVIGYDVVYEYSGRRYSTRLAQDPGQHIPLNVTVAPVGGEPQGSPSTLPAPVYEPRNPAPVVYGPPVYGPPVYGPPVYAPMPYYYGGPEFVVAPRVVIGGAWHGYRHY